MRIEINGTIVASDEKWIYDWFGIEAVSPKEVKCQLKQAKENEPVDVYINSGGGDVFAGSEIYSELRAYPGLVKIHVTGIAASAASVIACAGESDISPTAMLMIHNVSGSARGDYNVMDKSSETLQQANRAVAAAYVHKTGMAETEVLEMMNKETWFSASDAVERGLIDRIAESKNLKLVASVSNVLSQEVIEKIRNTVRNPTENESDFLMKNLQTELDLLKVKGGM